MHHLVLSFLEMISPPFAADLEAASVRFTLRIGGGGGGVGNNMGSAMVSISMIGTRYGSSVPTA